MPSNLRPGHPRRLIVSTDDKIADGSWSSQWCLHAQWSMHKQAFATFLLLWPWHWPDDLHIRTSHVFRGDKQDAQIQLPMGRLSKVIVRQTYIKHTYRDTDRQTDAPKLYTTPLRGWSEPRFHSPALLFAASSVHSPHSTLHIMVRR